MLSRNKRLISSSQLKCNKPLLAKTNLKSNSSIQIRSAIKPVYKKTRKDRTAGLAFPKNCRVQDQSVIDSCRRKTCEVCGNNAGGEPHHIVSRGANGPDIKENLIQLCGVCHTKAHSGELSSDYLKTILAHRLGISIEALNSRTVNPSLIPPADYAL